MKNEFINNVIVDNGILEHKVQYIHSPVKILNAVTRALFLVNKDLFKEINDKNLTLLIKTGADYENIKSKTIIGADKELLFRFFGID